MKDLEARQREMREKKKELNPAQKSALKKARKALAKMRKERTASVERSKHWAVEMDQWFHSLPQFQK